MNFKEWRVDICNMIMDEDDTPIALIGDDAIAQQIVQEHNEHLGMTLEIARLRGQIAVLSRPAAEAVQSGTSHFARKT